MNDGKDNETGIPGARSLESRAKQLFDDSVRALDGRTRSLLNRRRHEALDSARTPRYAGPWKVWAPAAGVAVIAVLAFVVGESPTPVETSVPTATAADLDLLMNQESFEMLEDLEFYSWMELDADDNAASGEHVG